MLSLGICSIFHGERLCCCTTASATCNRVENSAFEGRDLSRFCHFLFVGHKIPCISLVISRTNTAIPNSKRRLTNGRRWTRSLAPELTGYTLSQKKGKKEEQTSSVQSLDRLDRRGNMRDGSVEILFQSFLQEALVNSSGMGRDVHSLMLSIHHFLCRPQRRQPSKEP